MKKKLHKILILTLCCIFGLLCVGCTGNDSDYASNLEDAYKNGEISYEEYLEERQNSQSVPLYGTKVLYRPDSYDWNDNVGENNSNYYEQFSWWILKELMAIYGVTDQLDILYELSNRAENNFKPIIIENTGHKETGYYDSIRYQIQEYSNAKIKKINLSDSNKNREKNYFEITANTNKLWNWSFGLETQCNYATADAPETKLKSQVYLYYNYFDSEFDGVNFSGNYYPSNQAVITNNSIQNVVLTETDYYSNINTLYQQDYMRNPYADIYLGGAYSATPEILASEDYHFSDYVKALEYAIYCINLDLVPNQVSVTYNSDGTPLVSIVGYPATADKSSATVALESIQEVFKKIGTYVGVTERQQLRLKNWIRQNIIGTNSDSSFSIAQTTKTYTQYVKEVDGVEVLCDKDGNVTNTFAPYIEIQGNTTSLSIERNYDSNIDAIIDICTTQVQIGNSSGEGEDSEDAPNINDKYLASHVVDYFGNDMFIASDKGHQFDKIPQMEYQSMMLMFRKDFEFSNIDLHFRYDAGEDGDDIVDPDASITIRVYLHHYKKATNTWRVVPNPEGDEEHQYFEITVQDGPFSHGDSLMMLYGLKDKDEHGNQIGIRCKEWNQEIGGGVMNSITDGYLGFQSVGTPLPLNGKTKLRKYYQLIEPSETDTETNTTYSYGILNPAMFENDPHASDYFEIAFEVVKTTGDYKTNYKFQVGLGLVA